jgi:ribosomal protein L20
VFMASLKTRGITLNRKVLADLAVRDLPAFGRLVQAEEPATT